MLSPPGLSCACSEPAACVLYARAHCRVLISDARVAVGATVALSRSATDEALQFAAKRIIGAPSFAFTSIDSMCVPD